MANKRVRKAPVSARKRTADEELRRDVAHAKRKVENMKLKRKLRVALKRLAHLETVQEATELLKDTVTTYCIKPKKNGTKDNEATAVWVASDWHVEEIVKPSMVNGLNRYNMKVSKQRAEKFFVSALKLTNILARDVEINTIVLALLGDFITSYIHEEMAEITDTEPMHAILHAQELIASGIQYVLDNSDYNFVIPCHSGNHGRTTARTRFATENGHSLEYVMYHNLADHFKDNPRVQFLIADGYHSYVKVYNFTVRFHHGHAVRYGGGVGGITIPINKAIAQWNKIRKADLDVLGHFHTFFDGGNFITNGSMIGYNAYALSIKASFEVPKQVLFLIDKKRAKTCVWPILFN